MKLFVTWFLLGLGIFFSGMWCVAALMEFMKGNDDWLVVITLPASGGMLIGLIAVAASIIWRAVRGG